MRRIFATYAPVALVAILAALAFPVSARAQDDAAKTFKANCVLCHSDDGSGSSPTGKALKAKDLRSDEVQKKSDAELTETIAKGKGKMPAFGSKFSPDMIKSLVAYIRAMAKK
jgi:mono/diheme cytochrome c family protein